MIAHALTYIIIKMADKQCDKDGLGEVPPKRAVCRVKTFREKEKHSVCKHCGKTLVYHVRMSNLHGPSCPLLSMPVLPEDCTPELTCVFTHGNSSC